MHIQIANRLYNYTGNKACPYYLHSHPLLQPPTAAVVQTIVIEDYSDHQQTLNMCEDAEHVMDV